MMDNQKQSVSLTRSQYKMRRAYERTVDEVQAYLVRGGARFNLSVAAVRQLARQIVTSDANGRDCRCALLSSAGVRLVIPQLESVVMSCDNSEALLQDGVVSVGRHIEQEGLVPVVGLLEVLLEEPVLNRCELY